MSEWGPEVQFFDDEVMENYFEKAKQRACKNLKYMHALKWSRPWRHVLTIHD